MTMVWKSRATPKYLSYTCRKTSYVPGTVGVKEKSGVEAKKSASSSSWNASHEYWNPAAVSTGEMSETGGVRVSGPLTSPGGGKPMICATGGTFETLICTVLDPIPPSLS